MTGLDDETAERIAREAFEKYGPTDSLADYVRAGYAARDAEVEELRAWKAQALEVLGGWERVWEVAGMPGELGEQKSECVRREVEELRAELDAAWAASNARLDAALAWEARAEAALAVLAKVREYLGTLNPNGRMVKELLATLDESPTERETPANREDVARVLRDADRPDVPAHLPPSRNYTDMATALMERFTITDGGGSR